MTTPMASASVTGDEFSHLWEGIAVCAEELNLKPGDQLPSLRELADRLQTKPTVIRDALLQAQAKGAVRIVSRVGAFLQITPQAARSMVSTPDEALGLDLQTALRPGRYNLLHMMDARRVVEVELVGRAAELRRMEDLLPVRDVLTALLQLPASAPRPQYLELDGRFHTELGRVAGNTVLLVIQRTLLEMLVPHLITMLADVPTNSGMRMTSDRFHASIYTAVAEGDAPRARREMHEHLSGSYDYLLRVLQQPPTVTNPPAK